MKAKLIRLAWAGAMIFGGCGILWEAAGWKVAAGTFLVLWGHYVEKHHTAEQQGQRTRTRCERNGMSGQKTEAAAGSGYAGPAGSALPLGLSREDAIEALWETVKQAEDAQRRDDPSFVRWPDLDALIEHIEAHGFPPPNTRLDRQEDAR